MVKILYGVCGEGLGHASRSRILINHLKKKNHEIRIIAGGKAYKLLSKEFKNVEEIESAHFIYKNNEARLIKTVFYTIKRILFHTPKSFLKVKDIIEEYKPDIIITDADPIGNAVGFLKGIKRISIDNPHSVLYRKYKIESSEFFSWLLLMIALRITMTKPQKYIIYDFSDEQIKNKRVLFLKPLIQDGIIKQKPAYSDHIFVYQTVGSDRKLIETLKKFNEKFVVYGFNKESKEENIIFKKFNENEFYQDISQAKAIITNAGFTVISEALYLKKPIFCLPIKNQFEQMLNGKFIETLGAGISYIEYDENKLKQFFENIELYKKNLESYNPGKQEGTLEKIEEEILKLSSNE